MNLNIKDPNAFYEDLIKSISVFGQQKGLFFTLVNAAISNNKNPKTKDGKWISSDDLRNYFTFVPDQEYKDLMAFFSKKFNLILVSQDEDTLYAINDEAKKAFFDLWIDHNKPAYSDSEINELYYDWMSLSDHQEQQETDDLSRLKEKLNQAKGVIKKGKFSSVKGQSPQSKILIDELDGVHVARSLAFCYEKLTKRKARSITPNQLDALENQEIKLPNGTTYESLNEIYCTYPVPSKQWAENHLYDAFIKWNRVGSLSMGSLINTSLKVDMRHWGLKDYLQSKNIYIDKPAEVKTNIPKKPISQYQAKHKQGSIEDLESKLDMYIKLGMPAIKIAALQEQIKQLRDKN